MVEEIQEAVGRSIPVVGALSQLKQATLPALLEYGCLRWATNGALPSLPRAVLDSTLGDALWQVPCDLGLRSTGQPKRQLRRIDAQPAEFQIIAGANDFSGPEWEHFEVRFDRSAQSVGFSTTTAHALQAALHEMAENAVIHAESPTAILVGYHVLDGTAIFSVVDVGKGALESLRSHQAYQHLELHKDAIRAALHDGTTRFGPNTRGLGFRQVFKALAARWGHLRFRSGNGCVTLTGEGLDADQGEESFPPLLPGFQVTVCCRTTSATPAQPLV